MHYENKLLVVGTRLEVGTIFIGKYCTKQLDCDNIAKTWIFHFPNLLN